MPEPNEIGPLTSGIYQLRRLIAESAAFRERVGAADPIEARLRVKTWDYEDDPLELQRARPFAVVWPADRLDLTEVAYGGRPLFTAGGELVLILTDIDRAGRDREASGADFAGWLDRVLLDVLDRAGTDDRMAVDKITLLQRPMRTATRDEPSAGAFWQAAFLVTWK